MALGMEDFEATRAGCLRNGGSTTGWKDPAIVSVSKPKPKPSTVAKTRVRVTAPNPINTIESYRFGVSRCDCLRRVSEEKLCLQARRLTQVASKQISSEIIQAAHLLHPYSQHLANPAAWLPHNKMARYASSASSHPSVRSAIAIFRHACFEDRPWMMAGDLDRVHASSATARMRLAVLRLD
jgi:hypothetical protein